MIFYPYVLGGVLAGRLTRLAFAVIFDGLSLLTIEWRAT